MSEPQCFTVAKLTKEEGLALKALRDGVADPYQQSLALHVITNKFSRPHDLLFVPGQADQTAFLNGRAFVGMQILKYLNVPIGKLEDV